MMADTKVSAIFVCAIKPARSIIPKPTWHLAKSTTWALIKEPGLAALQKASREIEAVTPAIKGPAPDSSPVSHGLDSTRPASAGLD
jgi:hypothetical protein